MFSFKEAAVTETNEFCVLKDSICKHLNIRQQRLSYWFLILTFIAMIKWEIHLASLDKTSQDLYLVAQKQLLKIKHQLLLAAETKETDLGSFSVSTWHDNTIFINKFNQPFIFNCCLQLTYVKQFYVF